MTPLIMRLTRPMEIELQANLMINGATRGGVERRGSAGCGGS